jgi:hypothetical protein
MCYSWDMHDLTGKRFGRLLVLRIADKFNSHWRWLCKCDCGAQKAIDGYSLQRGATISCGCRMRETIAERIQANTKHGQSANGGTRTFHSWQHMQARCDRPTNPAYKDYGGRGISVCPRWRDFRNFLADMGECPPRKSIDRFPDNNGNYEPVNCRWATPREQSYNRRPRSRENRTAILYNYDGMSLSLRKWSQLTGILPGTIRWRIKHGLPMKDCLGFK